MAEARETAAARRSPLYPLATVLATDLNVLWHKLGQWSCFFICGFWGRGSHSLAVGLVASDGDLDGSAWALGLSDLLGDKSDTALLALSWEDTDGLSINQYSFPIPSIPPLSLVRGSLICAYLVVDESGMLRVH